MQTKTFDTDQEILLSLSQSDARAFDFLYQKFFPKLYAAAYKRLQNRELTEEVIQELFISLWERRKQLAINTTIEAYLFTSVCASAKLLTKSKDIKQKFLKMFVDFIT